MSELGLRGPAPKPAALKELEGNPGKRPIQNEPIPSGPVPERPTWAASDDDEMWAVVGKELEALHLLTSVDAPSFAMLRAAYEMAVRAYRAAQGKPLPVDEDYQDSAVKEFKDMAAIYLSLSKEFALTPASRARLGSILPGDKGAKKKTSGLLD